MDAREDQMRQMTEAALSFASLPGEERTVQRWLSDQLSELGFETYEWEPDPELLGAHDSFPPVDDLELEDRPSVAGVLEFGDPDAGPTVVLNGHIDVVPADDDDWDGDPFAARWDDGRLYGRGAVDMKSGLMACVFAALAVRDHAENLNGRIVVESVVGEEEGGIGAATAAASNPHPFTRDVALIAEPTEFDLVVASEGSLMKRLTLRGKSAHAAKRWEGESVLPHFERIRGAFEQFEEERATRVTHDLYDQFENPWPVNFGTVRAGSWASTVPSKLTSELRIGVAPHETITKVESEYRQRLDEVVAESEWLTDHPPEFERFSVQFEGSEIDPNEPVVRLLHDVAHRYGGEDFEISGFTGGTDARHYLDAGIPTVVFGPGSADVAHQPNEYIDWEDVVTGTEIIAKATEQYLEKI